MDQGLFKKYSKVLSIQRSEKEEIIQFIQTTTGVIFHEEELVIQKNKIRFNTTSVKKTILQRKEVKEFLVSKKYTLIF